MSYGTKTTGGYGQEEPCVAPKTVSQYDSNIEEIFYQLELAEKLLTTLEDRIYKVLLPDYQAGAKPDTPPTPSPVNSPLVEVLQVIYSRASSSNSRLGSIIDRVQL